MPTPQPPLNPSSGALQGLLDLTTALLGAVTITETYGVVLEKTAQVSGALAVRLIEKLDQDALSLVSVSTSDEQAGPCWQRFAGDLAGPVAEVLRSGQANFMPLHTVEQYAVALEPLLPAGARAVAALPLRRDGQVGAALVLAFPDERHLDPQGRALLLEMAARCEQALNRARGYQAERHARQRSALLSEAGVVLSSSLDVPETLERITALAIQTVADACAVFLPDDAGRMQISAVTHREIEQAALFRRILAAFPSDPQTPGSSAWVMATGQSLLVPAVSSRLIEAIEDPEKRAALQQLNFHSLIMVPMTVRGRTIGVLGLFTTSPARTLGEEDLGLARTLARRSALALDNATLYRMSMQAEERYRSLVDATRQIVWTTSPDGHLLGDQAGWARLTGQTRQEYEHFGWLGRVHPDDASGTLEAWKHAVAHQSVYDIEHRVRVADGTYRHFHARGVPVRTERGEVREWVGVHTDVTEQVQNERQLRELNASLEARVELRTRELQESERRFRSIFDSQFQFIGLLKPDGTVIEANRTALEFAGIEAQEVLGKPLWETPWWQTSPQTREELRDALQRAARGETVRYDVDVKGLGDRQATIDFSLKPVVNEQGKVTLLIPEGRLISDERRAAAVLQAVLSSAPLILYAVDPQGNFLLHEGAALQSIGLQAGAYTGQNMYELFQETPQVYEPLERALSGDSFHSPGEFNGRFFENWYQPWFDTRGNVAGMIGVTIDVTERQEAERQREEARKRAEVLASLGDALQLVASPSEVAITALGQLAPSLDASCMLVFLTDGTSLAPPVVWGELESPVVSVLARPDLRLEDLPILQRVVQSGQAVFLDDYGRERDHLEGLGGRAYSAEPIFSRERQVVGVLVAWRRQTGSWSDGQRDLMRRASDTLGLALERSQSAEHLQEQRDALESSNANLMRSNAELERFAYVASHDLQEPLRTIASFTQLIELRYGQQLDDNGRRYLSLVTRGAQRMKVLIDDLLVFSRLNAVREELRTLPLAAPFDEARQALQASIEQAGALVTHDELPEVLGDASELTQLFQNLLGNSLKFRRPHQAPRIHLSVDATGDFWQLSLADNGIGFEGQYAERIFQIFQRLHSREQYEGTGMGLAIARKIVERHGGQIWAESLPGEGTTFHFTLPKAAPAP